MACFFCFFLCSPFVQSHTLQRLSELMGFEWWERLEVFLKGYSVENVCDRGGTEGELGRQDVSVIRNESHVVFLTFLSRAWCLRKRNIKGHRFFQDT